MQIKYNSRAPVKKRILAFGDGFILGAFEVLSYFFEEIIYVRSPYVLPDVADCLSPDIILTSNAERYLPVFSNFESDKPFFINYFNRMVDFGRVPRGLLRPFKRFLVGDILRSIVSGKMA
ncbi:hypothetical protein [Amphritea pacifica]|uniref:hypothetical protein n=1 Tax=Amphritea pacifica TaxID=2811233 RepID=UPI001965642D|nr:hypothetical protein [Amphritea pacifica]MBN1008313.1 hypothetical protein [Amphritea pacifica]